MLVSNVSAPGVSAIDAPYLARNRKAAKAEQMIGISVIGKESVELSSSARARSLRLQGYSVQMISVKLGLDITTVNLYLGSSSTEATRSTYAEPKTTYTQPKAAYSEPSSQTQAREQLNSDLSQLSFDRYRWTTMLGSGTRSNVLNA